MINDIIESLHKHGTKKYRSRSINDIKNIIVHHSGTDSGSAEAFARYHVESNGWPGIGYHYVIDKLGNIYRCNRLETISYNTSGNNFDSVGVCLIGNFDKVMASDVQMLALRNLTDNLVGHLGPLEINWHSKYKDTTCPGKYLTQQLEETFFGCNGPDEII